MEELKAAAAAVEKRLAEFVTKENQILRATERNTAANDRLRRVVSFAILAVVVVAIVYGYFIHTNSTATKRSNVAIAEEQTQASNQQKDLQCIADFENARYDRDRRVLVAASASKRALDRRIFAEDAALRAALRDDPPRKVRRLAEVWRKTAIAYRKVERRYYATLRANPLPRLRKFDCAALAKRRAASPAKPTPTVFRTRTISVPEPVVVTSRVPGPTSTVTLPRQVVTTTVPPGKGRRSPRR